MTDVRIMKKESYPDLFTKDEKGITAGQYLTLIVALFTLTNIRLLQEVRDLVQLLRQSSAFATTNDRRKDTQVSGCRRLV